ncbi:MAG: hypothetical protein V3R58_03805, partial [candidate division NC10 bacterium]
QVAVLDRAPVRLKDSDPLTGIPIIIRRQEVKVVTLLDLMQSLGRQGCLRPATRLSRLRLNSQKGD